MAGVLRGDGGRQGTPPAGSYLISAGSPAPVAGYLGLSKGGVEAGPFLPPVFAFEKGEVGLHLAPGAGLTAPFWFSVPLQPSWP